MHHGAVHTIEDLVEDMLAGQHRADRHVPARQGLGQQHHVGFDVPVLDGKESTGTADAGLHLIRHEQRAIFPTQRGSPRQELVGRHVDALALDGLDDEGRDLPR